MTSYRPRRARGLLALCVLTCSILASSTATAGASVPARMLPRELASTALAARSKAAHRDHAAANAKASRRCKAKRTHRKSCAGARSARRHPAKRSKRARAKTASRSAGQSDASARQAPKLTISGQELVWTRVDKVTRYIVAIKAPGQAPQYPVIEATSTTPAPLAGATVDYNVRTDVEGSAWSPTVAISYPAATASPPAASPGSTTFQPGINSGSAAIWELPGAVQLGAKVVRVGMEVTESVQQLEPIIAAYAAQGIRVAPLAEFNGRIPSPAEAENLASWAKAFGPGGTYWATHAGEAAGAIQTIEYGNETSYSWQYTNNTAAGYAERAQSYALTAADAASAIKAANPDVGLIVQADSGNAHGIWVENMFKAVPDLGTLVAGWTVHLYGPSWRAKLEELIAQTAAEGAPSTIPIDVTEWGVSTDNGRCLNENFGWNACMSYGEAAEVLSRTLAEMREVAHGRLGLFLIFKIRDEKPSGAVTEREGYCGALQSELQPKGAYTTEVKAVLAGS